MSSEYPNVNVLAEEIAKEMLELYPTLEIIRSGFGIYAISYIPSYWYGQIAFEKVKQKITNRALNMEGKYLTRKDAIDAITPVLDRAKEKFTKILAAIRELESSHLCNIGYWSEEGESFHAISFTMDGFSFHFKY
jgi:hypothetical protein